jgi:adenine-specific DNA-methyltransferase
MARRAPGLLLIKIESSENKQHPWSGKTPAEAERIFAKTWPRIYNRFLQLREELINRDDQGHYYWELRSCTYWNEFGKERIVMPAIERECSFAPVRGEIYSNDKTNICIADNAGFVCASLNSSVAFYLVRKIAASRQNGYYEFKPMYVSQLPIPTANAADKAKLSELAEACQETAKAGDNARLKTLEAEIDQIVYRLFDLTLEEIALIENSMPHS